MLLTTLIYKGHHKLVDTAQMFITSHFALELSRYQAVAQQYHLYTYDMLSLNYDLIVYTYFLQLCFIFFKPEIAAT